jgi:hypothetical protein
MIAFRPFCAVIRLGNQYRSPRDWEEAIGRCVDEVWFFGVNYVRPEDKKLCEVLQAAACASNAPIHWMPLPRTSKEWDAAQPVVSGKPFKCSVIGSDPDQQNFQQNYCVQFHENSPRR